MTDKLHLPTQETYVRQTDVEARCPRCGSDELDWDASTHEGSHHQQRVFCQKCGFVWWDIYTITSYEVDMHWLKENGNPVLAFTKKDFDAPGS